MVASSTVVANMALQVLDEAPITSLSQDVKAARLCNLHYSQTAEAELTKNIWVFAIAMASVVGTDTLTGSGTLNMSYPVPSGALRILPLTHNGERPEDGGIPISWRREGSVILTDQESPRIIRYIEDYSESTDLWDVLFTDVVVAALAVKLALPLTHKTSMLEIARSAYKEAIAEARRVNAVEKGGKLYLGGWDTQRGDNRLAY